MKAKIVVFFLFLSLFGCGYLYNVQTSYDPFSKARKDTLWLGPPSGFDVSTDVWVVKTTESNGSRQYYLTVQYQGGLQPTGTAATWYIDSDVVLKILIDDKIMNLERSSGVSHGISNGFPWRDPFTGVPTVSYSPIEQATFHVSADQLETVANGRKVLVRIVEGKSYELTPLHLNHLKRFLNE